MSKICQITGKKAMVGTMFTKFNIGELFNGSLLSIGLSVAENSCQFED